MAQSDKPESGYRVEDFAGDVVVLLDWLGIERAVLAGHSGSCLVVRRAALDHPDRVAGLVLEASPTTLVNNANLIQFVESVVANLIDPIDPEFARSFVTDTSSENLPPELVEVLVEDVLAVPARVWKETFAALLEYDDVSELSMIEAPTLLVWGNTDVLVSRAMQDQLASTIPNAELAVYDGIGHTPLGATGTLRRGRDAIRSTGLRAELTARSGHLDVVEGEHDRLGDDRRLERIERRVVQRNGPATGETPRNGDLGVGLVEQLDGDDPATRALRTAFLHPPLVQIHGAGETTPENEV